MSISEEGLKLGHRYDRSRVNAPCTKCSEEASAREGRSILVLECDWDEDDWNKEEVVAR